MSDETPVSSLVLPVLIRPILLQVFIINFNYQHIILIFNYYNLFTFSNCILCLMYRKTLNNHKISSIIQQFTVYRLT